MLKALPEDHLPVQACSTQSLDSLVAREGLAGASDRGRLLFKWEGLFVSLYLKILAKISNQSCGGSLLLKSFDLLIALVTHINGMEVEQLDELLAELDIKKLTSGEKSKLVDKKELKKILANPEVVAKYLSLLLYKADVLFRLVSLVDAPLLDPWQDVDGALVCLNDEFFYGKVNFLDSLPLRNRVISWPLFLAILKNFTHGINFSGIDFTEATHQQLEHYIKGFVRDEYLFDENLDSAIKQKIKFLLKHQRTLRELVIVCLGNDKDKISEKVDTILAIQALRCNENEQSLSFVFYASLKALILLGNKDNLETLFSAFTARGISPEILIGGKLYDSIIQESERLDKNSEEDSEDEDEDARNGNDLYKLASNNINPVGLLEQIELSGENHIAILDWIWRHLFMSLSEEKRFDLVKIGLSNSKALERNNITLLDWYRKKIQELKKICPQKDLEVGLDYQDIFIKKIYAAWMYGREYGGGPYACLSDDEESRFAFNIQKENTAIDLFHWLKDNFKNERSFKWRELLFDLAITTKEKDIFNSAFDNFISFPDAEKVKKSYAVSRLIAVAVIHDDKELLERFWNKIINIKDKELQDGLKKRALVNRTWAFQQAIKKGNIELMDWILSRIATLPKEEVLSHLGYKYNLLYGIDLIRSITDKKPIVSAVVSGKIEVLNKIYAVMAGLIDELNKLEQTNEAHQAISIPIPQELDLDSVMEWDLESEEEFNQNEDLSSVMRVKIFTQLKQDYIEKNNFTCLGYIPVFYNNKDYIHQINESKLFTKEEKAKFITSAFKSAIKYNNTEMLAVVWELIEKFKPSISERVLFLMTIERELPEFYFSKLLDNLLKLSDASEPTKALVEKFKELAIHFPRLAAKTLREECEEKHEVIGKWLNQHPERNDRVLASSSYADAPTEPDAKKQCTKKLAYSFTERADELRRLGEACYSEIESCRDHPAKAVERGLKDDLPAGLQEGIKLEEETHVRKRSSYGS